MRHLATILLSGWILWIESGSLTEIVAQKTTWRIYEAYEFPQDCKKALKDLLDSVKTTAAENGDKVTGKNSNLIFNDAHGANYYCLPAEIDPRPRR